MEGTGKVLIYPTVEDLVLLNRRLIREYGGGFYIGFDNLANRGTLEHALVQMQYSIFGVDLYPTIFDKAALLAWRIITGHVFYDGNKRTGMASARLFLRANGYMMPITVQVVDVAIRIATGKMTITELTVWFESQIE